MPNKVPGVVAPLDPRRLVLRFPRDQMLEAWATSEVQQECPPFFPVVVIGVLRLRHRLVLPNGARRDLVTKAVKHWNTAWP